MRELKLQEQICEFDTGDFFPLSSKANSVIYLHPSTMKSLNLVKDSWVYIHLDKGPLALKCWPCDRLQTYNAALHSYTLCNYTNCLVTITPIKDLFDTACKVFLYTEKFETFMVSQDFQTFLENEMSQLYIREELKICVTYVGYPCYFTVKNIESHFLEKELSTELCDELEDMSLHHSDKILKEDSFLDNIKETHTSTPISSQKFLAKKLPEKRLDKRPQANSKNFYLYKFYSLHSSSKLVIVSNKFGTPEKITFDDIAGLDKIINIIKSSITAILHSSTGYRLLFPRGLTLVGPPGSGKSMIAQALKNECNLPLHIIDLQTMKSFEEKEEKTINEVFNKAHKSAPSIIFLDGLDLVFMKEDSTNYSLKDKTFQRNLVYHIYNALNNTSDILVFATARNINCLPHYLRKNNFFTKELHFTLTSEGRKKIILKFLPNVNHMLTEVDINELTDLTKGFFGGELLYLCEKAKDLISSETSCNTVDNSSTLKHIKQIAMQMKPTIPIKFEIPNVKWSDIGGMENVKEAVTRMVDWPLTRAHLFKRFKIPAPRGILLYGPPGCCKTMIAQALVKECKFNFIPVKASELFNKYVGESEKSVSDLFKKTRAAAPCVLFFDEVDSLTSTRGSTSGNSNVCDRILTQLLIEIDGIDTLEGVCILAATNRPDIIDPSFLRPGRFDQRIYIGLPDYETRQKIFEVKLCRLPLASDVDISYLVRSTEGYSGAEIATICLEASKYAIISDSCKITMKHFAVALQEISPKTTEEMKQFFKLYEEKHLLAK